MDYRVTLSRLVRSPRLGNVSKGVPIYVDRYVERDLIRSLIGDLSVPHVVV